MKTIESKLRLVTLLLLAGCSPVGNTIEVDAAAAPDAVATLALCGKETPLQRSGRLLMAAFPITCEGHGEVKVRFKDGGRTSCAIGYVTPGAVQDFRFRIRDGRCDPAA